MSRLLDRLWAAWNAFQAQEEWYVVVEAKPLGWAIVHEATTYDEASDWRRVNRVRGERMLVMTAARWQRQSLSLLRTGQPWRALAALSVELRRHDDEMAVARMSELAMVAMRDPTAGRFQYDPATGQIQTVGGREENGGHDQD